MYIKIRKREITLGLQPDLVAQPVLFAIDPYAHAMQQTNEDATRKILSNIYATRVELAEYEKKGKDYQYCFHLGLGNDAGAIFSTIPQVCEANGIMAWEWMAIYLFFKSRAVDGLDFHRKKGRFRGNVPELYYPKEFIPEYGERIVDVNTYEELSDEKTYDKGENDTEPTELESERITYHV